MKQVFHNNNFNLEMLISEMHGDGQDDSLVAVDVFDKDGDPDWGYTESCKELFLQMSGCKPQDVFQSAAFKLPIKSLNEKPFPSYGMPQRTLVEVELAEL